MHQTGYRNNRSARLLHVFHMHWHNTNARVQKWLYYCGCDISKLASKRIIVVQSSKKKLSNNCFIISRLRKHTYKYYCRD